MNDTSLIKNILKHCELTNLQLEVFKCFWKEKKLKKGEYLLRNGAICFNYSYVVSGALKVFYINDESGKEEILFFAIEESWALDIDSFSKQKFTIYNIQAIEDTAVLQINYYSFQKLLYEMPFIEKYFRKILEEQLISLQERIIFSNVCNAESRYFTFLKSNPQIIKRVPQYLIASYLGISAEFISRIKKKHKSS